MSKGNQRSYCIPDAAGNQKKDRAMVRRRQLPEQNEFIEKARETSMWTIWEYRTTQPLLPMAIMSAIDGRLSRLEDYIARRDFTRCVEQDMTNGIIAEAFEMDRDDLKRRRAQSVRNVRATNGTISLEKYARSRQEQDWDDDEWQD